MLEQYIEELGQRIELRRHAERASKSAVIEVLCHFTERKDFSEIKKVMEWIDADGERTLLKINRTGRRLRRPKKSTDRKRQLAVRALYKNSNPNSY